MLYDNIYIRLNIRLHLSIYQIFNYNLLFHCRHMYHVWLSFESNSFFTLLILPYSTVFRTDVRIYTHMVFSAVCSNSLMTFTMMHFRPCFFLFIYLPNSKSRNSFSSSSDMGFLSALVVFSCSKNCSASTFSAVSSGSGFSSSHCLFSVFFDSKTFCSIIAKLTYRLIATPSVARAVQ